MSGNQQPLVGYGAAAYKIANSLRFRSSASAYLSRTIGTATNANIITASVWVKRGALTGTRQTLLTGVNSAVGTAYWFLEFDANNCLNIQNSNAAGVLTTSQVFRDPSSWYHIVVTVDTTQSTASNRTKIYVNGVQVTSFSTANYPAQNSVVLINQSGYYGNIGSLQPAAGLYFDGYMAEINFVDGQALTPSSFGETNVTTGVWQPKNYTGTYGTNGFKLNFSNGTSTTTLGYDSSGNSNNWTTNNISLTAGSTYDWMLDSPTSFAGTSYGVGNYCVCNPLAVSGSNTTTNGNLTVNLVVSSGAYGIRGTLPVRSGMKSYFEINVTSANTWAAFGILDINYDIGGSNYAFSAGSNCILYYRVSGQKIVNGTTSAYSGNTFTNGDVIGVAVDYVNNTCEFFKNNTSQGSINLPSTAVSYVPVALDVNNQNATYDLNFGQRPFAYTPPSGHKSLCTYNLPTPTIQNGANYMAATLYTGTGSTQSISNAVNSVSFRPDFVWVKYRNAAAGHELVDSVRGAAKTLYSNLTNAEDTTSQTVTAFNAAGFSVGNDAGANTNGGSYIGWQWKAGGTAVTNTNGSITSSVSANTTAGFSVVTYTSQGSGNGTIGHGLGVAPALIINKPRTGSVAWTVYHQSLGNNAYLILNTTAAQTTGATTVWNSTSPDSSVFTQGSAFAGLGTMVAYCFAAIPGYSAFGSYTGNGSSDGPFVYLGFRPRFIMYKRTDAAADWVILDSTRDAYNQQSLYLLPDSSSAELDYTSTYPMDFVSNGWKIRQTSTGGNTSGGTYIYAAFAENPFTNALAR